MLAAAITAISHTTCVSVFELLSLFHLFRFVVVFDLVRYSPSACSHTRNLLNGWRVRVERSTASLSDCSFCS